MSENTDVSDGEVTDVSHGEVTEAGVSDADRSDDRPDRPPTLRFFDALGVRRNARFGAAAGLVLAFSLFVFFVVLPSLQAGVRPRTESPVLFVVLAFVVFVSTALFVATILTVRTAFRLLASPPRWVRRGGTVGALGGLAWVGIGLAVTAAALGDSGSPAEGIHLWLSATSLLLLPGSWAVYTRVKRVSGGEARFGAVVAMLGALATHVAAVLDPGPILGTVSEITLTPAVAAITVLAVGSVVLAVTASPELGRAGSAASGFAGLALVGLGSIIVVEFATSVGAFVVVPLGLAWLSLGYACRTSPEPAGWDPGEREETILQSE
ncbi:DUF7536 family protein [Haloarchaeobius sp. TZWWS8]|uniref:DUF7536 family protein n=1 Tax=Haloarchaeobius sp. TZWWS8 TaxID=3446121 RepID=UPI003EBC8F12